MKELLWIIFAGIIAYGLVCSPVSQKDVQKSRKKLIAEQKKDNQILKKSFNELKKTGIEVYHDRKKEWK
jgi:hypothetical protein